MLGLHCCAAFSLIVASGSYSLVAVHRLLTAVLLLLHSMGSRCTGFRGYSRQAQKLWRVGLVAPGMWDLPAPGMEPTSPALQGRFLTTGP